MSAPLVLLVEDDPDLGTVVGMLGRRLGHEVVRQGDVPSAWAALASRRPDLMLLDINLPGASGLELLRRARASAELADLPVALFSQLVLIADIAAGWAAGADYLVPKGLVTDYRQWHNRLQEILLHAHGRTPARSLGWPMERALVVGASWAVAVNQALDHPALRSLGKEVLAQVLARALQQIQGDGTPGAWVLPAVARLNTPVLPRSASAGSIRGCLDSLVDQLWCLLGTETRPFEITLRTALEESCLRAELA